MNRLCIASALVVILSGSAHAKFNWVNGKCIESHGGVGTVVADSKCAGAIAKPGRDDGKGKTCGKPPKQVSCAPGFACVNDKCVKSRP